MSKFDEVKDRYESVKFMKHSHALFMKDFIENNEIRDVIEIGFLHGKSSIYIGSILEDLGEGRLITIDRAGARNHKPNITTLVDEMGLGHRVEPIFAERSYTWELGKMIKEGKRELFDLCYFDGGHTWDATGFGFLLVDMLLRPGGWIIFDDLDWTIERSLQHSPKSASTYAEYSADEKETPGVRQVFETLVPHFGYEQIHEINKFKWGCARKPLG